MTNSAVQPKIIPRFKNEWRPIPGSTQELAIDTRVDQTLFCGTRGCGKTAAQLMVFRRMAAHSDDSCVGIIIDTVYKSLDNLTHHAQRIFKGSGRFRPALSHYYFEFNTGARLLFRAIRSPEGCNTYLADVFIFSLHKR